MFRKGQRVRVKNSLLEGTVQVLKVQDDGETLCYLVEYQDFEGIINERWFVAADLQEVQA